MTSSTIDRVTGLTGNVAWKPPCVAATTANITLAGLQTIDGIVLAEYDRVLVMNQTDNTTNGIYIASSGTWQRAADFDDNRDAVNGTRVAVTGGSTLIGAYQVYTTDDTVVFGTTSIVFIAANINTNDYASSAESIAGTIANKVLSPATRAAANLGAADVAASGHLAKWANGIFANDAVSADPAAITALSAAPAMTFTADGRHVFSPRNSNVRAYTIYSAIFPAIAHFDVSASVLELASGSTTTTNTAVGGYVRNKATPSGGAGNAVALFGCGTAEGTSSATWGLNTLLQDAASRVVGAATGRILTGAELDFNVMNTATQVIGVSVGGNSLSTPTNANAFIVNTLGTGIPWVSGFVSQDGAAGNGLSLGALATSGTSINSQKHLVSYFDSGAVKRSMLWQVQGDGFLILSAVSGNCNLKVSGGNFLLDTGKGVLVNGNTVLTDRQTGWTAGTGSILKGAFAAYAGQTHTGSYVQATIQALDDACRNASQRINALEAANRAHGLIGT